MTQFLTSFASDESAAVTVDWVVLTASLVGIGLAVSGVVSTGIEAQSDDIDTVLRGSLIHTSFSSRYGSVVTDFANDVSGWALSAGIGSAQMFHSSDPGSDGAPGYMRFVDTGNGGAAYLGMSTPYTGDQSKLLGGTIGFDMQMISGGRAIADNEARYPILRITGANGETMQLADAYAPVNSEWSSFSADVTADAGWMINGTAATQSQMEAILSDVSQSELRIEQAYGGGEIIGLDNVAFKNGSR
ncbi:hypothetical protein [Jannaschia sp. 2305UL9-9]|uniref:hypothetical protein n=1 Tax=Jannaschia sp. 2305UL9-9 TaxID=3121638 RepID=UPI00352772A2